MPGTEALPDALEPFARDHSTFLLANHGAVTVGATIFDAVNRMETLERVARITLMCRQLGGAQALTEGDLAVLRRMGSDGGA
jgi:L-fuculose-phosphate aldolase